MKKIHCVLVVDDNKNAANGLAKLLELDGYEVDLAYDGETALIMALATEPDAIILDINLPERNGYEVARVLKHKWNSSALLIALTAHYGKEEDKRRARSVGFDHHLTRPILVTEIEKLLGKPSQA